MKELAVIGGAAFTLGFRLAGIRRVYGLEDVGATVSKLLSDKLVGIVVINDEVLEHLSEHERDDVSRSVDPVFVVAGSEANQEGLRKMIMQSIGVDLLKEEQ